MFNIDLQLFGGGGSSSGLKGGGKDKDDGTPKGFLFYFTRREGPNMVRWIEGKNEREAVKNANRFGKENNALPGEPFGDHMTQDKAREWYKEQKAKKKK